MVRLNGYCNQIYTNKYSQSTINLWSFWEVEAMHISFYCRTLVTSSLFSFRWKWQKLVFSGKVIHMITLFLLQCCGFCWMLYICKYILDCTRPKALLLLPVSIESIQRSSSSAPYDNEKYHLRLFPSRNPAKKWALPNLKTLLDQCP